MSKAAPILAYHTPIERPPARVAVVLFLWSFVDLVVGIFFIVRSVYLLLDHMILATVLFCFGIILVPWAVITCVLAWRILKGDLDALERATLLTGFCEIVAWGAYLVMVGLFLIFLIFGSGGIAPVIFLMFFIPLPITLTVTSRYLRRAANHFCPPLYSL